MTMTPFPDPDFFLHSGDSIYADGPITGPNRLDATFGPTAEFVAAPPRANTAPLEGHHFFGEVNIDGASKRLTVDLRDLSGASLWSVTLDPQG